MCCSVDPPPVKHYENFPVASVLLPVRMRAPVRTIYAFARHADDIADEGDVSAAERLAQLSRLRTELDCISIGNEPDIPLFRVLKEMISRQRLPLEPFYHLLDAFTQDVTKQRYANFNEVLDYCSRSANPIGRLLLHLYGAEDQDNTRYSDAICSSLQIINFLQDIAVDYKKGRIYLPEDELARFGVVESMIARGERGEGWQRFMTFQIERAQKMLVAGQPLGRILKGRIGLELRVIIAGGQRILEKLAAANGDVFTRRPVLRSPDWAIMFGRALLGTSD
ncbi:MAG: squalene synthase HpnC [Burkholderiales bacterium]